MTKREIILKYIENRMLTLWDKLPDSQVVLDGKATNEDYFTTGAYTELEKFEKFIEENWPKSPFDVLEEKIKIDDDPTIFDGEPLDVDEEIIFKDN